MHDNSSNRLGPVAGFALLAMIFLCIYFFDKWVIKRDKPHRTLAFHDKSASLGKRAWHSFLWVIEIFLGFYLFRNFNTKGKPFRKTTTTEKRVGGCFMVIFPSLMILISRHTKSLNPMLDFLMYGHYPIILLYIGYIALITVGVFFAIFVAPKIPLFVSASLAVISWTAIIWLLFTGHMVN
jgi:hypothetical protein